jgi:LCP family protein required for cell wall assembly
MGKHSYSKQHERAYKSSYQPFHAQVQVPSFRRKAVYVASSVVASVMISSTIVAGYAVSSLNSNFETVALQSTFDEFPAGQSFSEMSLEDDTPVEVVNIGSFDGAFNVLIVGSDTREGQEGFGDKKGELNDVNILLSVNQDHSQAVIVSFPRDLIVNVPECQNGDSENIIPARVAPLNTVLGSGGLPCVARTIETLAQVPIKYAGMLTFSGVAEISTAIGGVPVCVAGPLNDRYSGLMLPEAGVYELEGYDALAFLRTRYNVGDGSDLSRISLQQLYLSSMLRKMVEEDVLNNMVRLYDIASVISRSAVLSSSLSSMDVMVSMARTFTNIPLNNVMFVMFPVGSGGEEFPGKVVAKEPAASTLVELVSSGEVFQISDPAVRGTFIEDGQTESQVEGIATLSDVVGQSASDLTCTKTR